MALERSQVHQRATGMGEPLMELRRRVYRRSISRDIGVIEAINELLTEVRGEEERQWLEWLRGVIEAYRNHRRGTAEGHAWG
jgi:hypothetical protein